MHQIVAKQGQVGQPVIDKPAVGHAAGIPAVKQRRQRLTHPADGQHRGEHLLVEKTHRVLIDGDTAHDPPRPGGEHRLPVGIGLGEEILGGNTGDGIVPVADGNGVQRDIRHLAAEVLVRHFNPVPQLEHVVGRQLNVRHQRQQSMLEHDHQYRRHGPQTGDNNDRRFVRHHGEDHNRRQDVD